MRAGTLDERVSLQSKEVVRDSMNQPVSEWTTEAVVWANVDVLSGHALTLASQYSEPVTLSVSIREGPAITTEWRVVWHSRTGDRTLSVIAILPLRKRGEGWQLMCAEGLRDAD